MSFGLCNASITFQCYIMAIFIGLVDNIMKIFIHNFLVFGCSFDDCFKNLEFSTTEMPSENLRAELEKVPLYGLRGNSVVTSYLLNKP